MRYFYEYKYKKGNRMVGGHNLEKIEFYDNYIKLLEVDIIPTNYDYEEQYWGTFLDMNEIEYLKIEPMLENRELKKKYENAVADYEITMFEKEQLKKQLEDKILLEMKLENELFNKRKEYQETYKDVRIEIKEYKTQQKEFIKYMNDIIEDLEIEDVDDEEMKGYLIQRINTFKEILKKYKSIIGDDK